MISIKPNCHPGSVLLLEIVNRGLSHGCSLSSVLFTVYLNDVLREWKNFVPFYNLDLGDYRSVCTDDQAVISNNKDTLRTASHEIHGIIRKYNLILSIE